MGSKNGPRRDKKSIKKMLKNDFEKRHQQTLKKKSASLHPSAIAHLYLPRTPSIFAIARTPTSSAARALPVIRQLPTRQTRAPIPPPDPLHFCYRTRTSSAARALPVIRQLSIQRNRAPIPPPDPLHFCYRMFPPTSSAARALPVTCLTIEREAR